MRNAETWKPTKYVIQGGHLRATSNEKVLGVPTRLIASIVAQKYDAALREHARGRLLDLGCGCVPLYQSYRDMVETVTCVDWADSLHPNDHIDLECDLSQPLPLESEFDIIILSDVLEHLPDPVVCWAEIARLLAPGGKVILNVPFFHSVHEAPHDYYRYTQFALKRFAAEAGLEVVSLEPTGGLIECFADILGNVLCHARLKFISAAVQSIAIRFWKSSRGQELARRTGQVYPLGLFMVARKPGAGVA